MRSSPRKIAVVAAIVMAGLSLSAPAAHALIDPSKVAILESAQKVDVIVMTNCMTSTAADPAGAVVIPPEVPFAGCVTF